MTLQEELRAQLAEMKDNEADLEDWLQNLADVIVQTAPQARPLLIRALQGSEVEENKAENNEEISLSGLEQLAQSDEMKQLELKTQMQCQVNKFVKQLWDLRGSIEKSLTESQNAKRGAIEEFELLKEVTRKARYISVDADEIIESQHKAYLNELRQKKQSLQARQMLVLTEINTNALARVSQTRTDAMKELLASPKKPPAVETKNNSPSVQPLQPQLPLQPKQTRVKRVYLMEKNLRTQNFVMDDSYSQLGSHVYYRLGKNGVYTFDHVKLSKEWMKYCKRSSISAVHCNTYKKGANSLSFRFQLEGDGQQKPMLGAQTKKNQKLVCTTQYKLKANEKLLDIVAEDPFMYIDLVVT